ncbi:MAG TPA: gamma-glutamyl-gamma-aminobutyrate hydrolase family protein [Solirubrobacteraceae bacterium]
MSRPVIGICTSLDAARFGPWTDLAALTPFAYVTAVQRAGGMALLLPPDPLAGEDPDPWLDRIDGLILAGGVDVDPETYGAERDPETKETVIARDEFEIALAQRAVTRDLPVLGICRGMQILNVAQGGTLYQHLPDHVGHYGHRLNVGTFDGNDHPVRLDEGSLAARAAGELEHRSLSHHHQGIAELGDGLVVSGRAMVDDLIEAVEIPQCRFVLGVQWHPEADEGSNVVAALVDAATQRP